MASFRFLTVNSAKNLLTLKRPRCTFMSAIHRGRLHSAIARFSAFSASKSGPGHIRRWQGVYGVPKRLKPSGAKLVATVTSIRYRASCLFPKNTALRQKFFQLDAQFVRLKGRTGCLGQQLDLISMKRLYREHQSSAYRTDSEGDSIHAF